ncbi:MAG: hypothetical protein RTU30_15665, partial [Candidatus Thorarchaeota archaeon]
MARKPIDAYRGLMETRFPPEIVPHMDAVVSKFANYTFAGHDLSSHLTRFLKTISRLIAYVRTKEVVSLSDLASAIDILDHFTSTSKWWTMNRKEPGFVIRPPSRDPRDFMKGMALVKVGSATMSRITGSIERLSRFLDEHEITSMTQRNDLCESLASVWVLFCAFICKSQGRNLTDESDFELAYDITRIILFHSEYDDLKTLSAVRRLGTSSRLPSVAGIMIAPGFESRLDSSVAAQLEQNYFDNLSKESSPPSPSLRALLTNSLRFLAQLEAFSQGIDRIEERQYENLIHGAMKTLERTGMPTDLLHDESAVIDLFNKFRTSEEFMERINLLIRRFEGLIVDSTGNRDFLFEHSKLIPRFVSLVLLVIGGNMDSSAEILRTSDLQRGLILLDSI